MSESIQKLLHDLSRAVAEAMAESSDCQTAIQRIHQEGLSLYLAIDRSTHQDAQALMEIRPKSSAVTAPPPAPVSGPQFRLDSRDVAFLESVGIDTTRSRRRRR